MKRFLIPFLALALCPSAQAIDYEKCEAINKAYSRQVHGMKQAMREFDHLFDSKATDPDGGAAWHEATLRAATPYQEKINRIKADYKAAGCH